MVGDGPKSVEDVFVDLNKYFTGKKKRPGMNGGRSYGSGGGGHLGQPPSVSSIISIVAVVLAVLAAFTSFYTVDPTERAVVTRFGRYLDTKGEGAHFKIPFGIDNVTKVNISVRSIDFGYSEVGQEGFKTRYDRSQGERNMSLLLSGDLNVADVEWKIDYRIRDPWKFLYHSRDPIQNLRDVSISIMRRVVGDRSVSAVLTTDREAISFEAKKLTQEILDNFDLGIEIILLKLQSVRPPKPVMAAFNEVNEAKQEQEETINIAEREYNKIIPEARGKAEKLIADAEGYKIQLINRAKGDVAQFKSVLVEYKKAPNITKKRLYFETIEELLKDQDNILIMDSELKGVLPVFNQSIIDPKGKG